MNDILYISTNALERWIQQIMKTVTITVDLLCFMWPVCKLTGLNRIEKAVKPCLRHYSNWVFAFNPAWFLINIRTLGKLFLINGACSDFSHLLVFSHWPLSGHSDQTLEINKWWFYSYLGSRPFRFLTIQKLLAAKLRSPQISKVLCNYLQQPSAIIDALSFINSFWYEIPERFLLQSFDQ